MKKWNLFLLTLFLLAAVACTAEDSPSPSEPAGESPPPVESSQLEDSNAAPPQDPSQPEDSGDSTPPANPQPEDSGDSGSSANPQPESAGESTSPQEPSQQPPAAEANPPAESASPDLPETSGSPPPQSPQTASEEDITAFLFFLHETLPQESYFYANYSSQTESLTIGYVQQDVIQAAISEYTGNPCPVTFVPADRSLADTLHLLEKIHQEIDLPSGAFIMEPAIELGSFPGAKLIIYADGEAQADEIQQEIIDLAAELHYPAEYLEFTRMTQGENPDT